MNNENLKTENSVKATNQSTPATGRLKLTVIGTAVVAAALVLAVGIVPRVRAHEKLAADSRENTHPTVVVTNVSRSITGAELNLPANVRAFEEAAIYARADGYLKKWTVDIGGKVEAGQVLAELDTPELDQELNQSRGTLAQAKANFDLARSTAGRWRGLLKDHAVSQQEVDEKTGALAAREADVNAAEAAVRRLEQLTNYKQVTAPFAGIVTRRNVDTGALILAGHNGASSPLFELARINTLRVYVDVPQAHMRDVAVNLPVEIRIAEFPERTFSGKVVRTAGALDAGTRTLLTEVQVDNQDGALMPGIHAEVKLKLAQSTPPIVVPGNAVIIRGEGTLVAVVDNARTIHLQPVRLGRDFGASIEVVAGLPDNSVIVLNPSDTLQNGVEVVFQEPPKTPKATQLAQK